MNVKELKEYLKNCEDNLEILVIRDGDIPESESHKVDGLYVISNATEDFKGAEGVYLVYDEE